MYSRILSWVASAALFFLTITNGSAQAQTAPTFTLDVAATAAQESSLTVAAPTTLSFKIIHGGGPVPAGLAVDVSTFTNAQGIAVPVSVSVGDNPDTGATHVEPGGFTQAILAVNLHVKAFPAPGRYTGQMIITTPGTPAIPATATAPAVQATPAQSTVWRFNLTSSGDVRPATLVVDQNAVTLAGVRAFCIIRSWNLCPLGRDDEPMVTVHVRDKTGNWPLSGVIARSEAGLKTPGTGFDWSSQLIATYGATPVDLFSSEAASSRTVDARGQGIIALRFKNLAPGEYTIPLRFTAANSGEDDLQKLTITLQVRDSPVGAVLMLAFAALFSFFATRFVSALRQRAAFLGRARALRPAWLANELPILPVTWLRATLRLAENLSNRFWLTGQSEIDARLTAARATLNVLDRVRQVRGRIETLIRKPMVRNRAIWKLDDIIGEIGITELTEQDVARIKTELDELDAWCDPNKMEEKYWEDLLPVIQSRCAEVELSLFPTEAGRILAQGLVSRLNTAGTAKSLSLDGKIKAEADYQHLSILWEVCRRQHYELVDKLVDLKEDAPLEKVHKVVDDHWWEDLNRPEAKLAIEVPGSPLDPWEAYETVTFRIESQGTPFLRNTYLMKKKLTYHWTITIHDDPPLWRRSREIGKLRVVSSEPQVAQYSPEPSRMKAMVEITYEGKEGPKVMGREAVPISKSTDFGIFAKYERADLIAFGLAATASIASGVTLYALKPTFLGSLQDYLTLFTWGASLDQGKNFLQSLGAYAGTTSQPPSQGGH